MPKNYIGYKLKIKVDLPSLKKNKINLIPDAKQIFGKLVLILEISTTLFQVDESESRKKVTHCLYLKNY